jgi:hypothetical protein
LDIFEDVPWLGPLQITLGLALLFLSILILLHPIIGGFPLIILISFGLLFAGSEKIITGALSSKKAHLPTVALGVGIMMVALLAFIFSASSTLVVTTLLGIILTIFGVSVIVFSGFGATIAGILLGIIILLDSIMIFSTAIREKPSGEKLSPVR